MSGHRPSPLALGADSGQRLAANEMVMHLAEAPSGR